MCPPLCRRPRRPGEERLLLSNKEDFERVDSVRADVDAILVGAGTLPADNPRLLVNSAERRASRVAAGQPEYPLKVTITGTGDLDPDWKFWHHGGDKLVLAVGEAAGAKARRRGHPPARAHGEVPAGRGDPTMGQQRRRPGG
ncbi:riboflavin biosynthesis pyrimidine reductase [Streptomyces sp. V1I6]|nr:riboflavin biosynthesis pyrimidine reductase [Streptomyces sp. V1I6]